MSLTAAVTGRLLGHVATWWRSLRDAAQDRVIGTLLVVGTGPVLFLAAWMEPDPAGVGTHKQLGLGGCSVLTLTGWPCPMCGMTTTFTHMAHVQPLHALATQPFGVVLFLGTLATFAVGIGSLVGWSWWRHVWSRVLEFEVQIAVGILVGMTAGWLYKCTSMGLFDRPAILG